jgi:4'-phosphopantetheinyl transferase EntD
LFLRKMLSQIYPSSVVTIANASAAEEQLHPDEACAVRHALPQRQAEFAAGRACAHRALRELGFPDVTVPRAADRSPLWPDGVVGSISHCEGFCGAVVARQSDVRGLGLDVERRGRVGKDLHDLICTQREKAALGPATDACDPVEVLFSAKESFYKAYHPATKFFLDFLDVDLKIDFSEDSFSATLLRDDAPSLYGARVVKGRFGLTRDRVFTGVVLES